MKVFAKLIYILRSYFSTNLLGNAARFSLFATIVPSISILLYFVFLNEEEYIDEYIFISIAIFLAIFISVLPLFKDFNTLSKYLNSLSLNRNVKIPKLHSSNTLVDLMDSINVMSKSWEQKKYKLNHQIIESKLLFNTIPDIILVVNSEMIVIKNNDQVSSIYNRNPFGENIRDVIKTPLLESGIRWVFADGVGKQFEITVPIKDEEKHFIVKIESYRHGDELETFAVVVLQDITEIKRTEKMFADFIANVSHEIKTPLSSIIGVVETIEHSAGYDEEAIKEFMPILDSQARRMSSLIHDLLNLAQVEKLQNMPPSDIVDIGDLIKVSSKNLEWNSKRANKNIVIKKAKGNYKVTGDFSQLVQVMENLITNSIKYSAENSNIQISYGSLGEKNSKEIFIKVKDTGNGIPKEYISRLTERFFRVDKSRSNKTAGTGLGLAIVKHILARHDATLEMKSEEGVGSEFTIIFAT